MLRGLYLAHTGMLTQQRRMDVVTNNLANATTAGFKQDDLLSRSFEAQLISRLEDPAVMGTPTPVGTFSQGVHIDEIATSFEQGALEETGLATDLALSGDALFAVETPAGERYTRSGNFKVSAAGILTTQEGWPVLGTEGPLNIGQNGFAVSPSGRIQTPDGSLQLRLVEFDNPQGLRKEGANLYSNFDATIKETAGTSEVRQGFLESSNVDLSSQMASMIEIYRSHEINQRMVKIFDEKLGKSVNEIGRL